MLMRAVVVAAALACALVTQASAQSSLTDQINSVYAVQQKKDAAEKAAREAQQAEQQRLAEQREVERREAERRRATEHAAAVAAAAKKQADAAAATAKKEAEAATAAAKKEAEASADKKRDQQYEDQLRALQIEQKKLELQAAKARVDRTNDLINAELKRTDAQTDVIQSQADANRNISSGAKVLLEKTGEAEVKKQSGVFSASH
jgi:hypothetical protein